MKETIVAGAISLFGTLAGVWFQYYLSNRPRPEALPKAKSVDEPIRRRGRGAFVLRWIGATAVGLVVGYGVLIVSMSSARSPSDNLAMIFFAAAFSATQWLLALRHRAPYAWVWIPSNALACSLLLIVSGGNVSEPAFRLGALPLLLVVNLSVGLLLVLRSDSGIARGEAP